MPFIAIALFVAAALGGGVSVASQQALPGDALYGFKVHINEKVEGSLALSEKTKADWNIEKAETRLHEAQMLAVEGRLDADAQTNIEANFNSHVEQVKALVAKLEAKGDYTAAVDVSARLQSMISAQATALAEAKASASAESEATLNAVITRVHTALDAASSLSAQTSANASVSGSSSSNTSSSSGNSTSTTDTQVDASTNVNLETEGGVRVEL